ncbi:hypothetical protein GCM10023144_04370 [Pigmentiphaga soli]|uniref:Uncharacterized protein n=1 Tax=Pigmentiphaga soli TaxID=1007095 RepID=A0ABP8GFN2_9BURK
MISRAKSARLAGRPPWHQYLLLAACVAAPLIGGIALAWSDARRIERETAAHAAATVAERLGIRENPDLPAFDPASAVLVHEATLAGLGYWAVTRRHSDRAQFIQGYLFARPMAASPFAGWYAANGERMSFPEH